MGVLDGKIAIVTGAGRGHRPRDRPLFRSRGARRSSSTISVVRPTAPAAKPGSPMRWSRRFGPRAARRLPTTTVSPRWRVAARSSRPQSTLSALSTSWSTTAGILRDKTIFNLEESDWDAVIDVHLKGHYCCTRPFAQYIRETNRKGCRIINFSSVSGLYGNFGPEQLRRRQVGHRGLLAGAGSRARQVRHHRQHDLTRRLDAHDHRSARGAGRRSGRGRS